MKKTVVLVIIMLVFFRLKAHAIGEVGAGVSIGFCGDPNNLGNEITSYNTAIEAYKKANTGVRNSLLAAPGAFVTGLNLRYQFNYILLRAGAYYMRNLFESSWAEVVNSHTTINKIGIETYQASSTLSFALTLPLKERAHLYAGGGLSLFHAYYRFFQSDPGTIPGLPAARRETFAADFTGYHFIMGAEFPVTERLTLCAEWIHQGGVSSPVKGSGSSAKRMFNMDCTIFIFGVNFFIKI